MGIEIHSDQCRCANTVLPLACTEEVQREPTERPTASPQLVRQSMQAMYGHPHETGETPPMEIRLGPHEQSGPHGQLSAPSDRSAVTSSIHDELEAWQRIRGPKGRVQRNHDAEGTVTAVERYGESAQLALLGTPGALYDYCTEKER